MAHDRRCRTDAVAVDESPVELDGVRPQRQPGKLGHREGDRIDSAQHSVRQGKRRRASPHRPARHFPVEAVMMVEGSRSSASQRRNRYLPERVRRAGSHSQHKDSLCERNQCLARDVHARFAHRDRSRYEAWSSTWMLSIKRGVPRKAATKTVSSASCAVATSRVWECLTET